MSAELAETNPVGPPTKWNQEIITKARQYLDNYQDYGKNIPTVARLSQVIGISKDRIYKWSHQKDKKELKSILSQLKCIQEAVLLENGLSNEFNPTITKLLLTKHGYHDNPQANQAASGIQVTVNRGIVKLETGGQTLTVDASEQAVDGEVLEHKP
jgi:hypothetical protein